jgi:integrase
MRAARPTAARDLALILVLGDMGLRSYETRSLLVSSIAAKRVDGLRPWLTVVGKGEKVRRLPIPTDVHDALLGWQRQRPAELASGALLFPRLGRPRRDGSFPDAGGQLSGQGLSEIVKPVMLAACGVPRRGGRRELAGVGAHARGPAREAADVETARRKTVNGRG